MRRIALLGFIVALALAACGGDSEPSGTGTTTDPSPTTTTSPTPTLDSSPRATTLNVATSSLGQILIDDEGRTLYLFMNDTANTSTCTGGCAQNWPPLLATGTPTGGLGVEASKIGTTNRSDGGTQVTYNGHPLYRFSGDSAGGQTNGQGVGGNWFVVSPQGEAIRS
ncbi:MAG: COG4315 family predicted lipoprotein [Actinomycetota bacterium]